MGDLRDQLNKAGYLSKKDLKRLKHEDRVRHKQEGPEAREKDLARSREHFKEQRARHQEESRSRGEEQKRRERRREETNRLKARVESQALQERGRGRKFFFETRRGWVPYLEVSPETGRRLEAGNLAIVDLPWAAVESFAILPREVAGEMAAYDAGSVRFLRGS